MRPAASARPCRAAASHNGPTSARRSAASGRPRRPRGRKCLSWPNGLRSTISSSTATSLAVDDGAVEPEIGLAARRRGMGEHLERRGDDRAHRRYRRRDWRDCCSQSGAEIGQRAGARRAASAAFHRRRKASDPPIPLAAAYDIGMQPPIRSHVHTARQRDALPAVERTRRALLGRAPWPSRSRQPHPGGADSAISRMIWRYAVRYPGHDRRRAASRCSPRRRRRSAFPTASSG